MRLLFPVCFLTAGSLLVPAAIADTLEDGFYAHKAEGWFWYDDPRAEEPETKPEPEPPAPPPPAAPEPTPETSPTLEEEPPPLSAAWLRENLPRYHQRAIDAPTPENVAAYLYLQRVALDKASTYARVAQRVVMQDPYLDETVRRPLASYAVHDLARQSGEAKRALVKEIAQRAAILFFYRSDCPHCHTQAPVLKILERLYGFHILPVSLDGLPLPGGLFPEFRNDAGQAARLGLMATPALFLAIPPDRFAPIGQGAMSADEIVQRLLVSAAEQGWISEAQLAETTPIRSAPSLAIPGERVPEDTLSDPARLVEYLREHSIWR